MDIDTIFARLWQDYVTGNPSAGRIFDLFKSEGEDVVNDHIAFRTLDYPGLDIDEVAKPFIAGGYVPKGEYLFSEKHLSAVHFEHTGRDNAPRVFISQLVLKDCHETVREIYGDLLESLDTRSISTRDLLFSGSLFSPLSFHVYEKLRKESEYAAWFYVFGFRANHFTVSVNSLRKYDTLEKVNGFLRRNGYILNTSGGEIKGTEGDLLRQSSTMADIVPVDFTEGTFDIPSCYYEFAQRYPGKDGRIFSGFIANSADKIFESTDFYSRVKKS